LAFLPFGVLALELLVMMIETLFYGTMDIWTNVRLLIIHWICTIIVWCAGLFVLNILSGKTGYNIFENKNRPKIINWIIIGVIMIITAIGSYIAWDMRFKPFVEFNNFTKRHGDMGIVVFVFQYIYYMVESMLFLAIVVFTQEFGERTFKNKIIPWGGIMCGLTWGLGHMITQDLFTGIYSLMVSLFYGAIYIQSKKNIKYAYIIIAVMFII
jgi:hypothetical protein